MYALTVYDSESEIPVIITLHNSFLEAFDYLYESMKLELGKYDLENPTLEDKQGAIGSFFEPDSHERWWNIQGVDLPECEGGQLH